MAAPFSTFKNGKEIGKYICFKLQHSPQNPGPFVLGFVYGCTNTLPDGEHMIWNLTKANNSIRFTVNRTVTTTTSASASTFIPVQEDSSDSFRNGMAAGVFINEELRLAIGVRHSEHAAGFIDGCGDALLNKDHLVWHFLKLDQIPQFQTEHCKTEVYMVFPSSIGVNPHNIVENPWFMREQGQRPQPPQPPPEPAPERLSQKRPYEISLTEWRELRTTYKTVVEQERAVRKIKRTPTKEQTKDHLQVLFKAVPNNHMDESFMQKFAANGLTLEKSGDGLVVDLAPGYDHRQLLLVFKEYVASHKPSTPKPGTPT